MNEVTVYRVETELFKGPYVGAGTTWQQHMSWAHSEPDTHPNPLEDGIGWPPADKVCGFATLDALIEWFAGYEDRLYNGGYDVSEILVAEHEVVYGGKQLMFTNKAGKRKHRLDIRKAAQMKWMPNTPVSATLVA